MIYIPTQWLKNAENEDKVAELLQSSHGDVINSEYNRKYQKVLTELEFMGETKIVDKIKEGFFDIITP